MGFIAYLSLSGSGREVGWGGRLFEAGRLLTFSAFRMGAYSRWALIRGWALIRINTVIRIEIYFSCYKLNSIVDRCSIMLLFYFDKQATTWHSSCKFYFYLFN